MKYTKLVVILLLGVVVSFLLWRLFLPLYAEQRCSRKARELKENLEDYYDRVGRPLIGGITPEMMYESCLESFGLENR